MHLTCVKKTFQYFEKATLFLLLLLGSFNFLPAYSKTHYFFGNATSFCSNLFLEDHLNVINLFYLSYFSNPSKLFPNCENERSIKKKSNGYMQMISHITLSFLKLFLVMRTKKLNEEEKSTPSDKSSIVSLV